jgi:hypothetical protein
VHGAIVVFAIGETRASWSAVAGAVLGSSVLGSVVGGCLTAWVSGKMARDEAWRTRLIDAIDAFVAQLGQTTAAIPHTWLAAVEEGRQSILDEQTEQLTAGAERIVADFEEQKRALLPLVSRIGLLFGEPAGRSARESQRVAVNAGEVLTRASWILRDLAEARGRTLGISQELWVANVRAEDIPGREDDRSPIVDDRLVAFWTRLLIESVEVPEQRTIALCDAWIRGGHPRRSTRSAAAVTPYKPPGKDSRPLGLEAKRGDEPMKGQPNRMPGPDEPPLVDDPPDQASGDSQRRQRRGPTPGSRDSS